LVFCERGALGHHVDHIALRAKARISQTRDSHFGSPLKLSRVRWVGPDVVVEVTCLTWTEDNLLRQVSYQASARTSRRGRLGAHAAVSRQPSPSKSRAISLDWLAWPCPAKEMLYSQEVEGLRPGWVWPRGLDRRPPCRHCQSRVPIRGILCPARWTKQAPSPQQGVPSKPGGHVRKWGSAVEKIEFAPVAQGIEQPPSKR
jgi:hypothetical protein